MAGNIFIVFIYRIRIYNIDMDRLLLSHKLGRKTYVTRRTRSRRDKNGNGCR